MTEPLAINRLACQLGMRKGSRAQASTSVACGGLDKQPFERSLAQEPGIGDAVQRDAARQAKVTAAYPC